MTPTISIAIPTVRTAYPKRGCIAQLLGPLAKCLPIKEVVVAGQPDASFLVNRRSLPFPVRHLKSAEQGRSVLRNLAVNAARGTHLMLLDDDTILVPHTGFRSAVLSLSDRQLLTFATRTYFGMANSVDALFASCDRLKWSRRIRRLSVLRKQPSLVSTGYSSDVTFPTNFCVCHRADFVRLGGLDEGFVGWGYEDVDLANRFLRNGQIVPCRFTATAIHIDHPISPNQMSEAITNHEHFLRKARNDDKLPTWSPMFFGVATQYCERLAGRAPLGGDEYQAILRKVSYFERAPRDGEAVARFLAEATSGVDVIGVAVYGSAANSVTPRDVDLCIAAGQQKERFAVQRMPSGKLVEVHFTSLSGFGGHLRGVYLSGDNGWLIYEKLHSLRWIYDYRRIVTRFIRQMLASDGARRPYLLSLYTGLVAAYLDKPESLETLAIGRHVRALAAIAGETMPTRNVVLNPQQCRAWFKSVVPRLSACYARWGGTRLLADQSVPLYPPNYVGHEILS